MKSKFLSKVKEKPQQTNVLYDVNKDIDKKKTTGIKDGSIICKEKVNRQFVPYGSRSHPTQLCLP